MPPEGSNVVAGSKRHLQFDELSLQLSKKSKKKKKNKLNMNNFKNYRKRYLQNKDNDVIIIDSDNSCMNFKQNNNDDIIILETDNENRNSNKNGTRQSTSLIYKDDVIILSSYINKEKILNENEKKTAPSKNNDNVAVLGNINDFSKYEDNVVINVGQTLCVDKIINGEDFNVNSCNLIAENVTLKEENQHEIQNETVEYKNEYPKTWTKEMIKFYTEPCEKNRNFDYKKILKKLKTKPSDWNINKADMFGFSKKKYYVQCRKCNRTGHIEKECKKKMVCYVCGEFTHIFRNCPNTICLTCGRRTERNLTACITCQRLLISKKKCSLCGQMYHTEQMCPSKWRKYVILGNSKQQAKQNPRKFCYNCAKIGHFGFECPLTPYSDYAPENPFKTALCNNSSQSNNDSNNNIMFISKETANILSTENGNNFLRFLSDNIKLRLEFFRGEQDYIKIVGNETKLKSFQAEFRKFKSVATDIFNV